jgi:integrase
MKPPKIPAKDEFPITIESKNSRVKIYRHENGEYEEFKVAFYLGGKRKMETFSDYPRAKARADEINDSVTDGNLEGIALSREECVLFQRAKEALVGVPTPLDIVAREYADAVKLLRGHSLLDAVKDFSKRHPADLQQKTVQEVLKELIEAKTADGASGVYLKDLNFRLGKFSDAFHCNVTDLTTDEINQFLRNLQAGENGVGNRSRNNYRRAIGTFIRFAETTKAIVRDEIILREIIRPKNEQFEIDIFTPDEMVKLLVAAQLNPEALKPGYNRRYAQGQGLLPLLVLGGFAGMRTTEICRQKWTDIHLDRDQPFIRVTAAKGNTAQKRRIPIHDNLKQWLLRCRKEDGLCCDLARPIDALMRLATRAKVEWKHNALRHSYISYRVEEIQDVPQTALEAGNSTRMINQHYRELVTPEKAKEWFNIVPETAKNIIAMPKKKAA